MRKIPKYDKSLVCGVGKNDVESISKTIKVGPIKERVRCPHYSAWVRLLQECYGKNPLIINRKRVTICRPWLTFSRFKEWSEANYSDGRVFDKYIISDGSWRLSKDNCIYVSRPMSMFFKGRSAGREFALGVTKAEGGKKYQANIVIGGKQKKLGRFSLEIEAHHAWQLAKADEALRLSIDQVDSRIVKSLLALRERLLADMNAGRETKTLF